MTAPAAGPKGPDPSATADGIEGVRTVPPPVTLDPTRPTWRVVLALALPELARQFLLLLVGLSDQYLAGHYQPSDPRLHTAFQAAQTNANYLAWSFNSYPLLVTVGATALVARFVGAADRTMAVRVANQAVGLAILLGLIGTAAGLVGVEPLVRLMEPEPEAAAFAVAYLRPLILLMTCQVVEAAGIACLVGAGDTRTGLRVLAGVAVVNLPLAWGLCWGLGPLPELGFVGIAVGTAVSHLLGSLAVLTVLARGRAGLRLRGRLMRPDPGLWRRILRIGVPAAADSWSVLAGQLWFLGIVNRLGTDAAAAHGIAIRWEALGYLSGGAFGTAAMALVGQNLGAGRPRQAARSGWVAFGLGGTLMCAMGVLFFALAPLMFRLFNPYPEQQGVIEAGVPVLRLVAFAMPSLAACIILLAALRGAGDTRVPVLFTWLGFLGVRIPLAYALTLDRLDLGPLGTWPGGDLGLFGAWLAMFADLVVRGFLILVRFAGGRWKRVKV
jgi:putative MATE family efflux protein